ncbi:FAD-dependent oxidoreductase, partial [Turicibacter sanguinis]|nr:FAD-dependent oxidoreductase [Turicibacter sanguinis]
MIEAQKKVIIVGAGIGGLASALRLLSKGYEVVIYEKNERVGGVVNQFYQDGYTFDLTASLSLIPQNFSQLFDDLNLKNELEMLSPKLLYRVFSAKGEKLDFSTNLIQLTQTLESISKKDSIGYLNLMTDIY